MTAVVGLVHKKKIYMGADSLISSSGGHRIKAAMRKVSSDGDALVWGAAGYVAHVVHAIDRFEPPRYSGADPRYWVAKHFLPALRSSMREAGLFAYAKPECDLLIGVADCIVFGDCMGVVHGVDCDYNAIGEGADIALGSLFETARYAPERRIKRALDAAANHCNSVAPPYHLRSAPRLSAAARDRRKRSRRVR